MPPKATLLVIVTHDTFDVRKMIKTIRMLSPKIETVVRMHNEKATLLQHEAADKVNFGKEELANAMRHHVLACFEKADGKGRWRAALV